ncbi:MAG: cytidine deaminase [Ruminococcus sp.]|nr:cytidine deaminase [Ruminococcus sp.]
MNTDAVFNAAQTAAIQLIESGNFIPPDSTVCAVETASGRIFTGISRNELNGHVSVPVHAETEAVKNMLASGERVITALLLINTQNRAPMLPCNNCIGYKDAHRRLSSLQNTPAGKLTFGYRASVAKKTQNLNTSVITVLKDMINASGLNDIKFKDIDGIS